MRQGTGCKGRLATLSDDSQIILDSLEIEHNHVANHDELKHEVFTYKLKEIVSNEPTIDPAHAVAKAEVLYGKTYQASYKSMTKFVSDIQRRLGVTGRGSCKRQDTKAAAGGGGTKGDVGGGGEAGPSGRMRNVGLVADNVAKRVRYQGELERAPDGFNGVYDAEVAYQQQMQQQQQQ